MPAMRSRLRRRPIQEGDHRAHGRVLGRPGAAEGGTPVEAVTAAEYPGVSTFKGEEIVQSDRPELTSARIIIYGGRSLGSAENFTK
jgi:electron transfer flavoprotein alpha subunit